MVEKMIKNTYMEIFIIIAFIFLSIPLWYYISTKWHISLAETINSVEKLELIRNNIDGYDNIIVNNGYEKTKKYQILLVTSCNCDSKFIKINKTIYQLKDLKSKKANEQNTYIVAEGIINRNRDAYKILNNLSSKNINYYYILEEIIYF